MPLPTRAYDRTINSEIERLLYQVSVVRQEAEGLVWGLNNEQFNWAPAPGAWSMAQCFDHLNLIDRAMIAGIESAMARGRANGILHDGPYTYGFIARWLLRHVQPSAKGRFKAPKPFQPALQVRMPTVLAEWQSIHERVEDLVRQSDGLDLAKIKVVSPVTRLLKYGLGLAFWILTAHDRRHLDQARQVRNAKGFPA